MLIAEPPPTPADLHFRLFGVPVRVHPFFWIMSLLLGLGGKADPVNTLIWVAVVFVSVLVHEMGHAFLQHWYGGHPRITLYSFGGLAACDDCDRSPRAQILISLAGPMAGFLLAALVVLLLAAAGRFVGFRLSWNPIAWRLFDIEHIRQFGELVARDAIISDLLWVNISWGILNLLPIYPLDGGRIARELFTLGNPRRGIISSLWLSVIAAGGVAVYAFTQHETYLAIMFGLLGYGSYQTLRAYEQHWR